MLAVHADAVITGDRGTIYDGAVAVSDDGRIDDVGPAAEQLPRHAGIEVVRVRGVVLPGLVNAHTHLELSGLRNKVGGGAGFVAWVERLLGLRVEERPEEDVETLARAVAELDEAGTSAVGEVTNTLAAANLLHQAGFAGWVFHEVFGLRKDIAESRLDGLPGDLRERVGAWPVGDLGYAPAAHTLYTTHADVVKRILLLAAGGRARTTLHLAEHAAERRFLENGDGPVADWYRARFKVTPGTIACPHRGPIDLAADLGALSSHVVLVHLTDARPEELARVAQSGASVVLCPRSNLHIETRLPPLLAMRAAGIEPALGTDSLASSGSLDVMAEARALHDRFPEVRANELVQMATYNGARALGRPELGRIIKGARPGLVAVEGQPGDDACAWLLKEKRAPRRWVVRRTGSEGEGR